MIHRIFFMGLWTALLFWGSKSSGQGIYTALGSQDYSYSSIHMGLQSSTSKAAFWDAQVSFMVAMNESNNDLNYLKSYSSHLAWPSLRLEVGRMHFLNHKKTVYGGARLRFGHYAFDHAQLYCLNPQLINSICQCEQLIKNEFVSSNFNFGISGYLARRIRFHTNLYADIGIGINLGVFHRRIIKGSRFINKNCSGERIETLASRNIQGFSNDQIDNLDRRYALELPQIFIRFGVEDLFTQKKK